MKKITAFIFCMSIVFCVTAQEHKNIEISYTPSTKQSINIYQLEAKKIPRKVQKIWYGKQVNFYVYSNPYLYDVYIASRQSSDEEITDSIAAKAFSDFASSSLQNLNTATAKVAAGNTTSKPADSTLPQKGNKLEDVLSTHTIDSIQTKYGLTNSYSEKSFYDFIDNNKKELTKSEVNASAAITELFKTVTQAEYVYKEQHINFDNAARHFSSAVWNLKEFSQPYNDILSTILKDNDSGKNIIAKLNLQLNLYPQFVNVDTFYITASYSMFSYLHDLDTSFITLKSEFKKMEDLALTYTQKPKAFKYDSLQFSQFAQADSLILAVDLQTTTEQLKNMIDVIKDTNSFKHYYHPIVAQKDTLFLIVKLKPSKRYDSLRTLYNQPMYAIDSFEYPIPIKGAFKLNFSVGAAFLQHNLRNFSYYFNPNKDLITDADSIKILQGRQNNKFRPVVTAFAHAYFNLKSESQLTPAITIGISANPVDLNNISYLLGGSLIFGHKNRFIATAGIAGASVDYLKGKYQTDKNYISKQFIGITETDLTEKAFKTGFFFGFSYNISNSR